MREDREYTIYSRKKKSPVVTIVASNPQEAVKEYVKRYFTSEQLLSLETVAESELKRANVRVVLNGKRKSVSYYVLTTRMKPYNILHIGTDILDIVNPDTYHNGVQMAIKHEHWFDVKELLTNRVHKYVEKALQGTDFEYCSIYGFEFKSPSSYNYSGDRVDFSLILSRTLQNKIERIASQDGKTGKYGFFEWAKNKYKSYPGYVSTMPTKVEDFMEALKEGPNHASYKFEKAVSMYITWEISKKGQIDYNKEFWDDVMETLQEDYSDYLTDYEEE